MFYFRQFQPMFRILYITDSASKGMRSLCLVYRQTARKKSSEIAMGWEQNLQF